MQQAEDTTAPHLLCLLRCARLLLRCARLLPPQRCLQLLLRLLQSSHLLAMLPRHLQLGVQLGGGLQAAAQGRVLLITVFA